MTMVIRKFEFPHAVSLESIIEKAEKMAEYPLKIEIESPGNRMRIEFTDIPGGIDVGREGENLVWLHGMTGEAPVLMNLLTLALMESGAVDTRDRPELTLPLSKSDILEKNQKFLEEFEKNIRQSFIGCAFFVATVIVCCIIGWFLWK